MGSYLDEDLTNVVISIKKYCDKRYSTSKIKVFSKNEFDQ